MAGLVGHLAWIEERFQITASTTEAADARRLSSHFAPGPGAQGGDSSGTAKCRNPLGTCSEWISARARGKRPPGAKGPGMIPIKCVAYFIGYVK
ncbi:hypothetical protein B0H99_102299 [Planomicrobium soli]|uniref:Uncharacterized protein n=1 Tax=Planomicrobium soli TaxID=1176648 RepID=A0A2P8H5V3_9BACL|nr:hypothetical protein [Planomicrobium soli]PSL41615.1 hypothetical protein B0H99_102299 [Planomicrobium soli]